MRLFHSQNGLAGVEAIQDQVKEGLFRVARREMDPDAPSGLSNSGPDFENPTTKSFNFEVVPRGPEQIIAQPNEHLVGQAMQEKSKVIGQETMTTESVHS